MRSSKPVKKLKAGVIKRLNLKPDDLVVAELDQPVTDYELKAIHKCLENTFPNNKIIVCPEGLRLKLIGKAGALDG